MKLSNKKIKYIKRQAGRMTAKEIAGKIGVRVKDVKHVLKQAAGSPADKKKPISHAKDHVGSFKHFHLAAILSLIFCCALIYSNTLDSPFFYDDFHNIKDNPHIRLKSLEFQDLSAAAFKSPCPNRPLANISFALNYYFSGYEVEGYHLVNIVIHIINGILSYFIAFFMFGQLLQTENAETDGGRFPKIQMMALFTALLFIAHPVQTQSVTYMVQRMNSMAAMFYLLAFLFYIMSRQSTRAHRQWLLFSASILSWVLALGAKEIAATFPLVILIYEWFFVRELRLDWLRRNVKYLIVLLVLLCIVVLILVGSDPLQRISADYARRDFTMGERVLTQFRVVVFYIGLVLFPFPDRQNLIHNFPLSHSLFNPFTTFLSLVVIVGLLILAIRLAKKQRFISFCILWFFINLAIESSVIGLEIIYEHRLYLPMLGVALLAGYLIFNCLPGRQTWAVVASVIIVLALSAATFKRNAVWDDDLTLWSDVVLKNPVSLRANNNLGLALKKQGRMDAAVGHFTETLRLSPDYIRARNNLGNIMKEMGKPKEAIHHYNKALQIDANSPLVTPKDFARTHNGLGAALAGQKNLPEAISHFNEALRIDPFLADAHNNLGAALGQQGNLDKAIHHFRSALKIRPGDSVAEKNLEKAIRIKKRSEKKNNRS